MLFLVEGGGPVHDDGDRSIRDGPRRTCAFRAGGEESLAVGRDIEGVPVPCVAWSGRAPNGDCLEMTYVVRRQGFDSMYIRVTFDDDDRMTDDLRSTLL